MLDRLLLPFTLLASILLCAIRMAGVERFPAARWAFRKVGVFPIDDETWVDVGQWAEYQKAVKQM